MVFDILTERRAFQELQDKIKGLLSFVELPQLNQILVLNDLHDLNFFSKSFLE
jgi:hypothetical protein